MQRPVYAKLAPVRRRQQALLVLRLAVWGLLTGSLVAIGLGLGRWFLPGPAPSVWVGVALLGAGPTLGALVGLLWRRGWKAAAVSVDRHYQLKDRTLTALAFLARPEPTVLHELQVEDAEQYLEQVEPRQVVPLRLPRTVPYAAGALVLAAALLAWPYFMSPADASPPRPWEAAVLEAQRIEEDLKELEEEAQKSGDKELAQLVEDLKQKAEELKEPGLDIKEALAKLSEMQAVLAAQQAQYNVGLVDGQLQALGEALSTSPSLDGAGRALQDGKYDKAAQELEELEDPQFTRQEARTLEEKLKQVAQAMGEVGLGQMSNVVSEMAEGIQGGKGKLKKAATEVAKQVRQFDRRKRTNEMVRAQIARIGDGKNNLRNGGDPRKDLYKSLSPSSNWGREISGNQGDKTSILAQRNIQEVTGNPGEGPSEVETAHAAEGRQRAARGYQEKYLKHRKLAEQALDSEPIPLGHRQTIRKYFELIRPQNADMEKKEAPEESR